jgi:hypothetical protein
MGEIMRNAITLEVIMDKPDKAKGERDEKLFKLCEL